MKLLTFNAAGKQLSEREYPARTRTLSKALHQRIDRRRPHIVSVMRARDPLAPFEETIVLRGKDGRGFDRCTVGRNDVISVVYLPQGGGATGGSSSRSKSPLSIVMSIAAVALIAFAGPIGAAVAGAGTFGAAAISAGVVLGASALLGLASKAKANKTPTDTTQIYGVAGGGNLPKAGDRIPRGYGRSWMKPDLSQPDFSLYSGNDQILYKRMTLGCGKYNIHAIRAGKQVIWTDTGGWQAPFDGGTCAMEVLYEQPSTLVPTAVISADGVGGMLPRPSDNPVFAGPFIINQHGALVATLQVNFQFPQGISQSVVLKTTTRNNQPAPWSVEFEYAPIDESGAQIGDWQVLAYPNSGDSGAIFSTKPVRFSYFKDVPRGRYMVRGRNIQPDTSSSTTNPVQDAAQWDGAYGLVQESVVRPGVTEVTLKITSSQATQAAAFGEIEIDAGGVVPVWDGQNWSEQETSKSVWAFLDVMHNQDYGGGIPYSQLDIGKCLGYANTLGEFDTFDAVIRGPVSVYEAASTVLLTMRAEPVHLGRLWSLVRDDKKSVRRHMITRRQIVSGTTALTFDLDTSDGAAHVIGEFDQNGDYRTPNQTVAIYGEASTTPLRQRWTGVRSYAHAMHLTRWKASLGAYRRQTVPFSVEHEGRIYRRGDSIAVETWFLDASKIAGILARNGTRLTLDVDTPVAAGDYIAIRDRTGLEFGPIFIASQGTSLREIVLDATSLGNVENATGVPLDYVLHLDTEEITTARIGGLTTLQENYLIQTVKPSDRDHSEVTAVLDDQRVWDTLGEGIIVPPPGLEGIQDPLTPRVLGLSLNMTQIAAGWRLDFAIDPGRGSSSFEVGVSYDGGTHYDVSYTGTDPTGSIVMNPVDPTQLYVRARAFGSTGLPGPYYYGNLPLAASVLAVSADGIEAQIDARVDQIFSESEAPPIPTGLNLTTASEIDVNGRVTASITAHWNASTSDIFGRFEVEIARGSDITQVNFEGGYFVDNSATWLKRGLIPGETYQVAVRAISKSSYGVSGWSAPVAIVAAKNTVPPGPPTAVFTLPSYDTISINWTDPTASDLRGVIVYGSNGNDFGTATKLTEVPKGLQFFTESGLQAAGTRYYWLVSVNTSDTRATTIVGPLQATTAAILGAQLAAGIIDATKLVAPIIAPPVVDTLPPVAGYSTTDRIVLRSDKKLYKIVNGQWVLAGPEDGIVATLSAAAISATELKAGAILADAIGVGLNTGNRIFNSEITLGGWYNAASSVSSGNDFGEDAYWTLTGTRAIRLHNTGAPSSGYSYADLYYPGVDGSRQGLWPVQPGQNYEFSAYLSVHRCQGKVELYWYNGSSYAYAGDANLLGDNGRHGAPDPSWRSGLIAKAPADAVSAILRFTMAFNGGSDPYLFGSGFYFGNAQPNQSAFSGWTPQSVTAITGGQVATNSLNADRIVSRSIGADRVAAGALTANEIAARTITAGNIATGTLTANEVLVGSLTGDRLAANTVTANKLVISQRNVRFVGVEFSFYKDQHRLNWSSGYVLYQDDNGTAASAYIPAGSVDCTGHYTYVYWDKTSPGSLYSIFDNWDAVYNNTNCVLVCTYDSYAIMAPMYGGTIIDGSKIVTGTITADRIQAGSITADQLSGNTLIVKEAQIGNLVVGNGRLAANAATQIATNAAGGISDISCDIVGRSSLAGSQNDNGKSYYTVMAVFSANSSAGVQPIYSTGNTYLFASYDGGNSYFQLLAAPAGFNTLSNGTYVRLSCSLAWSGQLNSGYVRFRAVHDGPQYNSTGGAIFLQVQEFSK